jgi:hypothetical protein
MPQIPAGRSYRIKNQRSGLYMNVRAYSANEGALLELWQLQPRGDANRRSQIWHVFPLDFGRYLLANKGSGLVVNVVGNSTIPGERLEQYHLQPLNSRPAQQWMLHDVAAGAVQIINDKSQLLANLRSWGTAPSTLLEQWTLAGDSHATAQHWLFEVEDEYRRVIDLPEITYPGIGDIHRMTSYQPTPSDKTSPVEVGAMAYPFPLVRDPAFDRRRQAQENPYYILRRYGYWERVYSYEHGGASDYTHREETTVGLTTTNGRTVEDTTSISVTAEASFGFKGAGASLSTTISRELKVTTTHEEVKSHFRTVTIERIYQAGRRVTEAIWYRSDKYVLERLNGTVVLDWVTRNPNMSIADAYPLPSRNADADADAERG